MQTSSDANALHTYFVLLRCSNQAFGAKEKVCKKLTIYRDEEWKFMEDLSQNVLTTFYETCYEGSATCLLEDSMITNTHILKTQTFFVFCSGRRRWSNSLS